MTKDEVISLAVDAMALAVKIGGPLLAVGLIVGLVVSVFQAVTQIQEQSLQFIPNVIGVAIVIVVGGSWMLDQLIAYARKLFLAIPELSGA